MTIGQSICGDKEDTAWSQNIALWNSHDCCKCDECIYSHLWDRQPSQGKNWYT